MKRGSLFIFILSLFLVMSLGVVSAVCGNGTVDTGHVCDDENTVNETECAYGSATCVDTHCQDDCLAWLTGLTGSYCGDGTTDTSDGETCDDGNTDNETECDYGTPTCILCNADCSANLTLTGSYCGDNITNTANGETCDDGNQVDDDGCSNTCGITLGPGTSIEDINVPQTRMCSGSVSGLLCNDTAAENYCINVLGYDGYVAGSKTCDAGGHTTGNLANHDINPAIGLCYNSDGDGDGTVNWTTQIKCYRTTAAQDCVDTDADAENPYFVEGGVTIDGHVTYENDSCISGILTEWYCESGLVKSKPITCSAGCVTGGDACKVPEEGLVCQSNSSKGLSNTIGQGDRDRGDSDVIFYCGLDLKWYEAKELGETCTAGYECISDSCVEEKCYGVRTELAKQANILQRIWCFLTNMGNYFSDIPTDYCSCLEGFEATDDDKCGV